MLTFDFESPIGLLPVDLPQYSQPAQFLLYSADVELNVGTNPPPQPK